MTLMSNMENPKIITEFICLHNTCDIYVPVLSCM